MKKTFSFVLLVVVGCSNQVAQGPPLESSSQKAEDPQNLITTSRTGHAADAGEVKKSTLSIKPLTDEERAHFLNDRLNGEMGYSFGQFSNLFLVTSRLQFGIGVGLMTSSKEVANAPLRSPFPASYQPTLREFLDAIALQTASEWKYDPTTKYIESDAQDSPIADLAIFEFLRTTREKPFEVTLADGWKAIDKGNWVMHVPPSFPVGMDIYELGTYSTETSGPAEDFPNQIRSAVALEWARRVNSKAVLEEIQTGKVGAFDACSTNRWFPPN